MILTRSSSRNCKMTFIIGRGLAERQILKKWKWLYLLNWVEYFDKLLRKHWYWHPRDCKMTFFIGRGFAELQILKKWKWPYLLNWVENFDKLLRKHWYWQDLAQEIAKWHFSLGEALPSSKFWKSDNGAISGTEWNIVMEFCIHIDINKMYPMTFEIGWVFAGVQMLKKVRLLQNDIYHRSRLCREPNSEKVKIALSLELSGIYW